MGNGYRDLGIISGLGSFILLAIIAIKTNGLSTVINEFPVFLLGGAKELTDSQAPFLAMLAVIITVVVINFPLSMLAGIISHKVLGSGSGEHAIQELLRRMEREGKHFSYFSVRVVGEELFARWFFLGVLTTIPFLSGTLAFYLLFLLGNGIWALIHLRNFEEPKDRHPLRVLPQLIAGIFFTFIFVKYGLLASILVHFASNALTFSLLKVQRFNRIDLSILSYSLLCAAVSYWLMEKPIIDILPWFTAQPTFALNGWGFWDYLKVSVFVASSFEAAFSLLFFDRAGVGFLKKETKNKLGLAGYLFAAPIVIGLMCGLYYGLYLLLGLFIADVPSRIIVVAIILSCVVKCNSGSSIAKVFWTGLPTTYITIAVLQALNPLLAIGFITVKLAIDLPALALKELDD